MAVKFKLKLSDKNYLKLFVKTGRRSSNELNHAYILLALDNEKSRQDILEYYKVSRTTIWRIKNRYLELGLDNALINKVQAGQPKKYEKTDEDELVRLTKFKPPHEKDRWTIQLLIETLGRGNAIKKMNRESVRKILKNRKVDLFK